MTEHERGTEREQHDRLQAEYRWEMSEEGELKRELWRLQGHVSRARDMLLGVYPEWRESDAMSLDLPAMIDAMVGELLQLRGKLRRLEILKLKGGE
jgi:hypothetical protein